MSKKTLNQLSDSAPLILPSLLMCDFGNLEREICKLRQAGINGLHLDVMDGHFVPNLTYGMPIVQGLRRYTDMFLDVHMMISDPKRFASDFVKSGADLLTFHTEAVSDPIDTAKHIRELGVAVGVAINVTTPIETIFETIPFCDLVLVMSVEAGFGGQSFNSTALSKVSQLKKYFPGLLLQIDGGISVNNIDAARIAGCDLFVVGSAIFGKNDYGVALSQLRTALGQ